MRLDDNTSAIRTGNMEPGFGLADAGCSAACCELPHPPVRCRRICLYSSRRLKFEDRNICDAPVWGCDPGKPAFTLRKAKTRVVAHFAKRNERSEKLLILSDTGSNGERMPMEIGSPLLREGFDVVAFDVTSNTTLMGIVNAAWQLREVHAAGLWPRAAGFREEAPASPAIQTYSGLRRG